MPVVAQYAQNSLTSEHATIEGIAIFGNHPAQVIGYALCLLVGNNSQIQCNPLCCLRAIREDTARRVEIFLHNELLQIPGFLFIRRCILAQNTGKPGHGFVVEVIKTRRSVVGWRNGFIGYPVANAVCHCFVGVLSAL